MQDAGCRPPPDGYMGPADGAVLPDVSPLAGGRAVPHLDQVVRSGEQVVRWTGGQNEVFWS